MFFKSQANTIEAVSILNTLFPKSIIFASQNKDKSYVGPQKQGHNKFKKIEIISSISSDHNDIKLKINYNKETGKFTNIKQNATN